MSTYHLDLIVNEGQRFIVRCPQHPAWRFKQHGNPDSLHANAESSLREHIAHVARFQWWNWEGKRPAYAGSES